MKPVLAIALLTGAVMTGAITATSASARAEPSAAQLASQLDQNGVATTYVAAERPRWWGSGWRRGIPRRGR